MRFPFPLRKKAITALMLAAVLAAAPPASAASVLSEGEPSASAASALSEAAPLASAESIPPAAAPSVSAESSPSASAPESIDLSPFLSAPTRDEIATGAVTPQTEPEFPETIDLTPFLNAPTRDEIRERARVNYNADAAARVADTPTYRDNHKMTWNIASVYYYLDPSVTADHDLIANAGYSWVHTGYGWNNLYPCTQTTNKANAAVDFYQKPTHSDNEEVVAYTLWYIRPGGGEAVYINANDGNWLFAEVWIVRNLYSQLSRGDRQAVIIHELGHCWGLNHYNSNPYSIMCTLMAGRQVVTIQQCDHNTFKKLYG